MKVFWQRVFKKTPKKGSFLTILNAWRLWGYFLQTCAQRLSSWLPDLLLGDFLLFALLLLTAYAVFFDSFSSLLPPILPQLNHSLKRYVQFCDSLTIWREFCGNWLNQRNSTSCPLCLWQCFYLFRKYMSFDPKSHKTRKMSNKLSRCIIWPGAAADYNCCSLNVQLANPVLP